MFNELSTESEQEEEIEIMVSSVCSMCHLDEDEVLQQFTQESSGEDGGGGRSGTSHGSALDPPELYHRNAAAATEIYSSLPRDGIRLLILHSGTEK